MPAGDPLERIEAAVAPLARKLAIRLAYRRRHQRRGRLDVRRTIRRSLSHGGALIDPRFRPPRVSKPEIVLLCDVSGSMASFARFTMQFTYAIGTQFSRVRSFAFIDEIDEVTDIFSARSGFGASMAKLSEDARVVGYDGHSDYGAALSAFWARHRDAITSRTTLIVAGDARNNFRAPAADVFGEIVDRGIRSLVVHRLLNGNAVTFRYTESNGQYRQAEFSLSRSKQAMRKLLGYPLKVEVDQPDQ